MRRASTCYGYCVSVYGYLQGGGEPVMGLLSACLRWLRYHWASLYNTCCIEQMAMKSRTVVESLGSDEACTCDYHTNGSVYLYAHA